MSKDEEHKIHGIAPDENVIKHSQAIRDVQEIEPDTDTQQDQGELETED